MTNNNFVPETLTWCRQHYVPSIKEHINCPEFGKSDGTNGSCWWCMEMTPYQWHMCQDESWVRGLLSPTARIPCKNREEACQFIEDYKQKHPKGNERKSIISEEDLGTWVRYSSTMMECSNCKKHVPYHRYQYCPHCGAKNEVEVV